jgi:ABC-type antimicrobial peptide transport system permease subunit
VIAAVGIVAGAIGGIVLARLVSGYITEVSIPGVWPIAGAATILVAAAILASAMPAARASRVDVIQALRAE